MVDLKEKHLVKGIMYIAGGFALLLYTFGLLETGINIILMIVAIAAILYGALYSGILQMITGLFRK